MRLGSGAFEGEYSYQSRFEEGPGTNPEELIGAAHAGCFSMAFSADLGKLGYTPRRIVTRAQVYFERVEGRATITRIHLDTRAEVPGIDQETFQTPPRAPGRAARYRAPWGQWRSPCRSPGRSLAFSDYLKRAVGYPRMAPRPPAREPIRA